MIIQQVIIKSLLILIKNTFFQELKQKITILKLMVEIFMINQLMTQLNNDEIRKISTGQGDDYTTRCLLDFNYFEQNYRLIAADLSKQKALDSDLRAIQKIIFTGKIKVTASNTRVINFYILEKSKIDHSRLIILILIVIPIVILILICHCKLLL